MSLTKFGKTVREFRRQAKLTLMVMATELSTSPAFLSAMETGRRRIPEDWVSKIANYFDEKGLDVDCAEIKQLAYVANESVPLNALPIQHQMLVAGFASSELNKDQLKKFADLLEEIYKGDIDE